MGTQFRVFSNKCEWRTSLIFCFWCRNLSCFAWISSFPSCIIFWHVLKLFSKSSNVFLFYFRNAVYNFFLWSIMIVFVFSNFSSSFVSIWFIFFSYEIWPWLIQSMADTWQINSEQCLSYKYLLKSFKSCFWCSEVTHFAHTYYFVNL